MGHALQPTLPLALLSHGSVFVPTHAKRLKGGDTHLSLETWGKPDRLLQVMMAAVGNQSPTPRSR